MQILEGSTPFPPNLLAESKRVNAERIARMRAMPGSERGGAAQRALLSVVADSLPAQ
ncbi:MAG: hypothetical protein U9R56_01555 [candidate division Zixibacteria bacterium]|nr:hypothetical protein [candidate division Zixibacteria bacterium]